MPRKLAGIAVLLAVALAVWLLRGNAPNVSPIAIPEVQSSRESSSPSAERLSAPERDTASEREVLANVEPAEAPERAPAAAAERGSRLLVRVVARDTQLPCAAAWIALHRTHEDCDAQGRFELRYVGASPPAVLAGAPGFLERYSYDRRGDDPAEMVIELERAASLIVLLEDAPKTGYPTLSVVPDWNALGERAGNLPREEHRGGTVQGYFDAEGRAELSEVPPNVPLHVRVFDGQRKLLELPRSIELMPGEQRELHVRLWDACRLEGIALDEQSAPVPGLTLWLLPSREPGRLWIDPSERGTVITTVTTDEKGQFVFDSVLPGSWRIGPAVTSSGRDLLFLAQKRADTIAPVALPVEVFEGRRVQKVEYRVQQGIITTGKVLDPDGNPASGALVIARADACCASARSGTDGSFAVGPLPRGSYEWTAQPAMDAAPSEALRADAGTSGLTLRLRRFTGLAGRVVDVSTTEGVEAEVSAWSTAEAGTWGAVVWSDPDGSFEIEGLVPGSYGLAASTPDGRASVFGKVELAAGGRVSDLVIVLRPAAKLRVSYAGDELWCIVRIEQAGIVVATDSVAKGISKTFTAPAGPVRVVCRLHGDGKELARELSLVAGEERELVFKEQD